MKIACIQMRSGVDIAANIDTASEAIRTAADQGATVITTPEMTSLLDLRPGQSRRKIVSESEDLAVAAFSKLTAELEVWLLIGSVPVLHEHDVRYANRSLLFAPDGKIAARYDKIHMFDVEIGDGQAYHESKSYRPGDQPVLIKTPDATLGLTICYDLRFPYLFRSLAYAGAEILVCPAAFTRKTGQAHWHTLLRARAIETGSFVIAPAQGGKHEDGRETYGHSLIVSPWGEIIAELDHDDPGILLADIDLSEVAKARSRLPSLSHTRALAPLKLIET